MTTTTDVTELAKLTTDQARVQEALTAALGMSNDAGNNFTRIQAVTAAEKLQEKDNENAAMVEDGNREIARNMEKLATIDAAMEKANKEIADS
jgi:alkyl hydroperoxide reductase subunit AhpC